MSKHVTMPVRRAAPGMLCMIALTLAACGGATITAPPRDPNPIPPAFAPLLSYYRFQHHAPAQDSVADAHFGQSLALGDFNGDGRLDIAAGAPGRENGRVFLRQSYGASEYWELSFVLSNLGVRPSGGDQFGWSLAACDFNGDGFADLAMGAPQRDLDGEVDAGEVFVLYGARIVGLSYAGMTSIHQEHEGDIEEGDMLGWSLAAGDFNADGFCDLAAGAPGEDQPRQRDAGSVLIRWGSTNGLGRTLLPRYLTHPEPQAGAQFGYALAAGQYQTATLFGGERTLFDLAVSSPFRDVTAYSTSQRADLTYPDAGEVIFYWGGQSAETRLQRGSRLTDRWTDEPQFGRALSAGRFDDGYLDLLAAGAPNHLQGRGYVAIVDPRHNEVISRLYQDSDGLTDDGMWALGLSETGDQFGAALAAGDFDGDGREDLAIGSPSESWRALGDGAVYVRFGGRSGPGTNGAYFLGQGGGVGNPESGDAFGTALAAGDLSGDGHADLVIGCPHEDVDWRGRTLTAAGAYFVAISRAPAIGPFEGTWTGEIEGDDRSRAAARAELMNRAGVVRGTAEVLRPGIIVDINEVCAPRDDDDEEPSGAMSFVLDAATGDDRPRHLESSGTFDVAGYDIGYTLVMDVAADLQTITARLTIDVPALCGGDKRLTATLEKQ